jgi:uncharacterized protein YjbJ (UPF0337 family)
MNWDLIQGDWMQFKDKVRKNWAKLTDEDLTRIGGRRDELIGRLRLRQGRSGARNRGVDEGATPRRLRRPMHRQVMPGLGAGHRHPPRAE